MFLVEAFRGAFGDYQCHGSYLHLSSDSPSLNLASIEEEDLSENAPGQSQSFDLVAQNLLYSALKLYDRC